MTVLDADFDIDLAPAEGDEVPLQVSVVVPERQPPDWASLLKETEARVDEERARANVAELRREELCRSEGEARSVADSLTRQLETFRAKLKMAAPKTLTGTVKALERRVESQDEEIAGLRLSQRRSWEDAERTEARHQDEINWLKQDLDKARSQIAKVFQEGERVAGSVRRQFERQLGAARRLAESREGTIAWLRERNDRLRAGVARATALIASLRESNRGLRAEVRDLKDENAAVSARADRLQAELDKLRSTRSVLSKALFGSRSEKQGKKGTGRSRGQQQGSTGHGRTERTGLGKRKERHEPPQDDRVCPRCGKPYAANGHHCSTIFEVDVEAWERTIIRPRYRPTCDCAPPQEVTAPPATRLFENTAYGISVWTCMLYERFVCLRPLSRVAAWLADMGLPISPGTLADSIKRFVPLFQPLAEAILAHQNEATLRQADETSWRVQEYRRQGRSGRAWLWTSISDDAVFFHVDPSRSAKVAIKLFESVKGTVVLVCDRYSAYLTLARELAGKVILQWCWSHQRRTFLDCAAGHVRLRRWCERWIERIAEIYRLNEARLEHHDRDSPPERQSPAFDAAQAELRKAVDRLFADAEAELAGMSDKALKAKALRSLVRHREGLYVFVDRPLVPMDNNRTERILRDPVIGRRLSFGSDSERGAGFTAMMYSVARTLAINGIDVRRWLKEYLTACAENGGRAPDDLSPWLPWSMSEARRRELAVPQ